MFQTWTYREHCVAFSFIILPEIFRLLSISMLKNKPNWHPSVTFGTKRNLELALIFSKQNIILLVHNTVKIIVLTTFHFVLLEDIVLMTFYWKSLIYLTFFLTFTSYFSFPMGVLQLEIFVISSKALKSL